MLLDIKKFPTLTCIFNKVQMHTIKISIYHENNIDIANTKKYQDDEELNDL